MKLEVVLLTEEFVAIVALIFGLFQMGLPKVLGQVTFLGELFLANVTAVWLFSSVTAHMLEILAHGKVGKTTYLTIRTSFVAALE